MKESNSSTQSSPEQSIFLPGWVWLPEADSSQSQHSTHATEISAPTTELLPNANNKIDLFKPLRQWLDQIEIQNSKLAHLICKLIPAQCPFERDVVLFGRKLLHIPPMCKLNPVYEQVVSLRFRALCYLADECGEDVTPYC
ncbi:Mo-dependent nitrogenase C-terminal domain-containing protein [Leptolyngbya sp. FACHB-541]|nr:Mo-dependent nitrogenase C-terminal domain-containing protein [Leptolyngbya sp. FACHB-541]MBD1999129.1 Mo-dependent nitrogenase C-terminal domain-containing protein [Leptolyngbya sp. FACHB-541]